MIKFPLISRLVQLIILISIFLLGGSIFFHLPTATETITEISPEGTYLFSWHRLGQSNLYILPPNQKEPLRLTNGIADLNPAWSPDGTQIAFSSYRNSNWDIYLLNLADGQLKQLTNSPNYDGYPRWSPDGQWLVYESYNNNNLDLYLLRSSGNSTPIPLTTHLAIDNHPAWSPDGRQIIFSSWRNGQPDLYLLSLDKISQPPKRVTSTPDQHEIEAVFSPIGTEIAFTIEQENHSFLYTASLSNDKLIEKQFVDLGNNPLWESNNQLLYIQTSSKNGHTRLLQTVANEWQTTFPIGTDLNGRFQSPSWTANNLPINLLQTWPSSPSLKPAPLFNNPRLQPHPTGAPYILTQLPLTAPAPTLNERVAPSFNALRARVQADAGWDFLGEVHHMFEPINSRSLPGQTNDNWHKTGRAFNIYYRLALSNNPKVEIVREDIAGETYWRIYLKTAVQDGSLGQPLRQIPWDFQARYGEEPQHYDQGGTLKSDIPTGYYIDFTQLASDYDWERIPSNAHWRTYFHDILFWQFENRGELTWEEAMSEIYLPIELNNSFPQKFTP